jgi:hypothetical protein
MNTLDAFPGTAGRRGMNLAGGTKQLGSHLEASS